VAKKMTDDFFKAFQEQLNPSEAKASSKAASLSNVTAAPQAHEALSEQTPNPQSHPSGTSQAIHNPHDTPMVPAWWLAPACVLGALIAISAARWMY